LTGHTGSAGTKETEDLREEIKECEARLEKGAEYVDYLQAQIDEMTKELENFKKADEVCRARICFCCFIFCNLTSIVFYHVTYIIYRVSSFNV
jgi:hypothetical protein